MRRLLLILLVVGLAVYAAMRLLDQGHSTDGAEAALELVRTEGMARLGYADQAPLAYDDAIRGLTGEGPEIARAVLERLGVAQVEGVLAQPDRLVRALYARRFEVIAAGLEVTPDGCEQVLFSEPTHAIGEAFLVRSGNPLGLHSYEDAAAKNAYIGVVAGSPQHGYGINAGLPIGRIRVLTSVSSGVASLASGVIDAFAADGLTVQMLMDQSKNEPIERALPFTGPKIDGREVRRYGAFAFRKGDTGLAREFNRHLADFLGTPEHVSLVRRFGITEVDLPAKEIRIADLCSELKVAALAATPGAQSAAR